MDNACKPCCMCCQQLATASQSRVVKHRPRRPVWEPQRAVSSPPKPHHTTQLMLSPQLEGRQACRCPEALCPWEPDHLRSCGPTPRATSHCHPWRPARHNIPSTGHLHTSGGRGGENAHGWVFMWKPRPSSLKMHRLHRACRHQPCSYFAEADVQHRKGMAAARQAAPAAKCPPCSSCPAHSGHERSARNLAQKTPSILQHCLLRWAQRCLDGASHGASRGSSEMWVLKLTPGSLAACWPDTHTCEKLVPHGAEPGRGGGGPQRSNSRARRGAAARVTHQDTEFCVFRGSCDHG
jgi:hypothetical protein